MSKDSELKAMESVYESLNGLPDKDAQHRVIQWIVGKLCLNNFSNRASSSNNNHPMQHDELVKPSSSIAGYDSVADIVAATCPKTDVDRVLIVAAFLQEKSQKESLSGFEITEELKHLGYPLSNITSTIGVLMTRRPQLMIQTRKSGKSKQARKEYKVSKEGINFVNNMINRAGEDV